MLQIFGNTLVFSSKLNTYLDKLKKKKKKKDKKKLISEVVINIFPSERLCHLFLISTQI